MSHTYTHTYAVLEVSPTAYREIRARLAAAGYEHAFHTEREGGAEREVIDMHGIALAPSGERPPVETRGPAVGPAFEQLVAFLYVLMRDHVEAARVRRVVDEHVEKVRKAGGAHYSDQALHAEALAIAASIAASIA